MHSRLQIIHFQFILKSLCVGIIVGIVVSCFRWSIEKSLSFWQLLYQQASIYPTLILIILIANLGIGLFIGYLSQKQPHIMGSGIPEVEGQLNNQLHLAWWPILWRKFIAGILAIGSGLVLGREGPSIQLGAAIGQGLGEHFENNPPNQKVILAAGAAAGLAAAFNAPLAGTFFVLEEIYHNFSPLIWMSTLASSLSADFISMNIFSLTPVLHLGTISNFPLNRYWQLILFGIIIGLLGYLYQRALLSVPTCYQYFFNRLPRAYHGCIALLLIIPLGYFCPYLLGGGNKLILHLATIHWSISGIIILFLIRFIVSMIDYGSGLPGGIFLPILSLGALLGLLFSRILITWQWLPTTYISNFIVLGMASYFACISKAPFTAILLITEMVGSLNHLMPLALTALSAYIVVDLLGGAPIYTSLLEKMQLKRTLTIFSDNNQIFNFPIFNDSLIANQQVKDIKWPAQTLLINIQRGEHQIVPNGDTIIQVGDTLQVSTNQSGYQQLQQYLQEQKLWL